MNKSIIHTTKAPAALGPYSQAVQTGNLVFCSGQCSLDPETGEKVGDDILTQSRQTLDNVCAVLAAAQCTCANVVKTTCFLASMDDFLAFNTVYTKYFPENPPARSCVAVKTLPKNLLVEVEVIAVK